MTTFTSDISTDVPVNKEKKKEIFQGCPVFDVGPEDFHRNCTRDRYRRFGKYEEIRNHIINNKNYDFWVRNKVTKEMYHNLKNRRI